MSRTDFDYVVTIGGEAGQGMQTLGILLAKAFLKIGYYISTYQSYQSRVRGGHNYVQVRVSSVPIHSMVRRTDILVALSAGTVAEHGEVSKDSIIIFDSEKIKPGQTKARALGLEISKISSAARENELYANSLYMGVITRLLGCPPQPMRELLKKMLGKKGDDVVQKNLDAFSAGLAHVEKNEEFKEAFRAEAPDQGGTFMTLDGNQSIALGAIAANCRFYTGYPMTPSTGILVTMAANAEQANIVVEQAEDEVAALNMVLGASYAGVRSMTSTSGGGFALMVEALSLCGMTECPAVIALVQRPGPATGLPTRTEQGDLNFAIYTAHGEFARVVLTPGTHEECFYLTTHAFNLADRYQIPVIIMSDQYLADLYSNVPPFDARKVKIDRGKLVKPNEGYRRYADAPDGVSPRAIPGQGPGVVIVDSDEHNERGNLTEDLDIRIRMNERRLKKLEGLTGECLEPEIQGKGREYLVMCWGSTRGPCLDAVRVLQQQGHRVSMMHVKQVWPLDATKLAAQLKRFGTRIMVEGNARGQLADLIQAQTGVPIEKRVLKYNGMPFFQDELVDLLKKQLKGKGTGKKPTAKKASKKRTAKKKTTKVRRKRK